MESGPIVVVEDDIDDRELFHEIIGDLQISNKLVWFTNCEDAWHYLKTTSDQPFIIFSDVNLPKQNGIEFKRQIDADAELRRRSIPFVFYSTSVAKEWVDRAFTEMTVQGFFKKGDKYDQIKKDIRLIIDYWKTSKHPNSV